MYFKVFDDVKCILYKPFIHMAHMVTFSVSVIVENNYNMHFGYPININTFICFSMRRLFTLNIFKCLIYIYA